tara:strand:- start:59 stop:343 length:285 start_codon:yes stop_codon:yes gene_type:complete
MINNLNSVDIYGFLAAGLTTIAFLPQLVKTWQTKSADDVSVLMLVMFILGVSLWAIYGWKMHALPVLVANVLTFILNVSILVLKLFYSMKKNNS